MMNFASPLFVDIVLCTIYVLLLAAVALTAWSVVRGLRTRGGEGASEHGVPARKIALLTLALLLLTLGTTWLLGSTAPLTVNGKPFTSAFWLKTSDMLIATPVVLAVVLVAVALWGKVKK